MQLLILVFEEGNQRAAHGVGGILGQLVRVQPEFANRFFGLFGALDGGHGQAPGKQNLPGFDLGKMGCLRESGADFPGVFGQFFVALVFVRSRRLFADKLLRHLVEYILALLQIGSDALD